jgi:hypothetical protein
LKGRILVFLCPRCCPWLHGKQILGGIWYRAFIHIVKRWLVCRLVSYPILGSTPWLPWLLHDARQGNSSSMSMKHLLIYNEAMTWSQINLIFQLNELWQLNSCLMACKVLLNDSAGIWNIKVCIYYIKQYTNSIFDIFSM